MYWPATMVMKMVFDNDAKLTSCPILQCSKLEPAASLCCVRIPCLGNRNSLFLPVSSKTLTLDVSRLFNPVGRAETDTEAALFPQVVEELHEFGSCLERTVDIGQAKVDFNG